MSHSRNVRVRLIDTAWDLCRPEAYDGPRFDINGQKLQVPLCVGSLVLVAASETLPPLEDYYPDGTRIEAAVLVRAQKREVLSRSHVVWALLGETSESVGSRLVIPNTTETLGRRVDPFTKYMGEVFDEYGPKLPSPLVNQVYRVRNSESVDGIDITKLAFRDMTRR